MMFPLKNYRSLSMKILIIIFLCTFSAFADDLEKLFQREYTYLVTQKNSYLTQEVQFKNKHKERVKVLDDELSKMEKELAKLTVENEVSYQEVQRMESFLRDNQNSENYLKRIYKNASEAVTELNSDLILTNSKDEMVLPNAPKIEDFKALSQKIMDVLYASTKKEEIKGVYRNSKGDLVEGRFERVGKIAVNVNTQTGLKPLGPSPEGVLVEIEGKKFSPDSLYLFEKITEQSDAKKLPDIVDKLATIAPILILSLMFFAVCGLFAALIRE